MWWALASDLSVAWVYMSDTVAKWGTVVHFIPVNSVLSWNGSYSHRFSLGLMQNTTFNMAISLLSITIGGFHIQQYLIVGVSVSFFQFKSVINALVLLKKTLSIFKFLGLVFSLQTIHQWINWGTENLFPEDWETENWSIPFWRKSLWYFCSGYHSSLVKEDHLKLGSH